MEDFKLDVSSQLEMVEHNLKAKLYKGLHNEAKKRTRFVILPIGVGCSFVSDLISVAIQVSLVFENGLKGSMNIFGFHFLPKGSFKKGCKQLFWDVPSDIILLPFLILAGSVMLLDKPFRIMRSPIPYTEKLWLEKDKGERESRLAAKKEADFNMAWNEVRQYPTKIAYLFKLASYYLTGEGVKEDRAEAIKHYKAAALLGDAHSMKFLARIFDTTVSEEGRKESLYWYEKTAQAGDFESMYHLGIICWSLEGRRQEGFEWLNKAATGGNSLAAEFLQKLNRPLI